MKHITLAYLTFIHGLLILTSIHCCLIRDQLGPDAFLNGHDYYMTAQEQYFTARSKTLNKEDGLVFIGDSIVNGLCVESVFNAVNFGISGYTVRQAKNQVDKYINLESKTIILALGINDVPCETKKFETNYTSLIEHLPKSAFVIISSILPIDDLVFTSQGSESRNNININKLNASLKEIAKSYDNVAYIDSGQYLKSKSGSLNPSLHGGDGLHPNRKGYRIWIVGLQEEFAKLVEQGKGGNALQKASKARG